MEMFCGGIFFGIIISIIMICLIAMVCKYEPDEETDMESETAKIALQTINMDLLSGTERKAIYYAIESIDIRNKIENWLKEKEENENK